MSRAIFSKMPQATRINFKNYIGIFKNLHSLRRIKAKHLKRTDGRKMYFCIFSVKIVTDTFFPKCHGNPKKCHEKKTLDSMPENYVLALKKSSF